MVEVNNIKPPQPTLPVSRRKDKKPPPGGVPPEGAPDETEDNDPPLIDEYA